MLDGRYLGDNGTIRLDLRVDAAVSRAVSGDVFRVDLAPARYVASFRTSAAFPWSGTPSAAGDAIDVTDLEGHTVGGAVVLRQAPAADALTIELRLSVPVAGLPGRGSDRPGRPGCRRGRARWASRSSWSRASNRSETPCSTASPCPSPDACGPPATT